MSFQRFSFHPKVAAGIEACGFVSPTPIQEQAIPPVISGRDLLGLAQTGTGKTAAFVLPILQRLIARQGKGIRALILAPTRELAEQIHQNICSLAAKTGLSSTVVYGGVSKLVQLKRFQAGPDIVVACPGRLLDHLNDRALTFRFLEVLVLDEADHMFDRGFLPDVRRIVKQLPQKRQTLVFSATMPDPIRHLTQEMLNDPVTVQINHTRPVDSVSHLLFEVAKEHKTSLLKQIIAQNERCSTLVFTKTKHKAKSLAQHLEKSGLKAASLQGNLSQARRQQALDGFRDGTYSILVATDIAARGIDVTAISQVINYDVPDTVETYTHRTGRTGRASHSGKALTFAGREDREMVRLIEKTMGQNMARQELTAYELTALPREEESLARPPRSAGNRPQPKPARPRRATPSRPRAARCNFGLGTQRKS